MPNSRECLIRNVVCRECPGECRTEVEIFKAKNILEAAFDTNIPGEIISAAENIRTEAASNLPGDKFPGAADTVLRHSVLNVIEKERKELQNAQMKVLYRISNL